MARIEYSATTVGGSLVAQAASNLRKGKDLINRAKLMADEITGAGTTPAALDGSVEFNTVTGQGSILYYALKDMLTALNLLDNAIEDIDMGG